MRPLWAPQVEPQDGERAMSETPAWLRAHGTGWTRGDGEVMFDNPWIRVTRFAATAPTGNAAAYGLVGFKNHAIAILPIHDDGTIMLVGQHRLPAMDYSWEIPEGGGPLDEDPLDSAKRELAEETGLRAATWLPVLRAQLSNSVTDEQAFGYIAMGLSVAVENHEADDTEAIEKARVPFSEALDAAMAGRLKDLLTVAMLLKAYHMAKEGELPAALAQAMVGD